MDKDSPEFREEAAVTSESIGSIDLLQLYRSGDSQAAAALFDRYVTRLVSLARSRLGQHVKQRVDAEDVVQSAYRSFFVGVSDGRFSFRESHDVWRLLTQITVNKLHKQAARQTAAKRDARRDEAAADLVALRSVAPRPDEAAVLVEELRLVTERLSANERVVLSAVLRGQTVEEVAKAIGKTDRTVRRLLARTRGQIERRLNSVESDYMKFDDEIPPLDAPLPYSDLLLERLIGVGGMGKVYRGTQRSTGERVAIKALRKDRQSDPRAVRQFLREAAIIQRLNHPGIIQVRGLGRFPAGGYFIVMDHIDGEDLQSRIDREALDLAAAVAVVTSVASAVGHAHAHGVIHCDLKPANIMLGAAGEVVVTDFGFAQLISEQQDQASLGGTIGYLAPEIVRSRVKPTATSDIYSLGVLLTTLVQPLSHLSSLCARCVAEEPKRRPQSMNEFISELVRCQETAEAS